MRMLYLLKKEITELIRQRELLVLIFLAPLLQIIILGYVITTDIKNIPVDIVNTSRGKVAQDIVTRIQASPLFRVRRLTPLSENVRDIFQKGEVKAVIILREALDKQNLPLPYPEIQILMDGVDANTSLVGAGYVNGIIREALLRDLRRQEMEMPLENKTLIRYNPRLRSIHYMGPGIVAILLTILALFVTSMSLVREKEQQTLDTLLLSQLRPLEIYAGKALPAVLIGFLNMILGIFIVVFWFRIPLRGNLAYLFLASFIYLAAILSYSLLISIVVSSQQQAMFYTWFSLMTMLILSGFLTPLENLKAKAPVLMVLADINPFRYLIKIIREIFLKGNGLSFFWKELFSLAGIAVVITSLSLLNFRRLISR